MKWLAGISALRVNNLRPRRDGPTHARTPGTRTLPDNIEHRSTEIQTHTHTQLTQVTGGADFQRQYHARIARILQHV